MHWLYTLWFGYWWPSLKGNGPEALTQTVLYGAAAYLFVPPVRRWVNNHMNMVHAKLDHIIKHHPDIPEFTGQDPTTPGESPATPPPSESSP